MATDFSARVGAVLSGDIAVPEAERVRQFYSRVMGTGASPFWQPDLLNNLGLPILGIGAREGAYADLPIQWMPHIQVQDVDASVSTALKLGGSLIMDAKDESGTATWAVLMDPQGAAFGIMAVSMVKAFQGDNPPLVTEEPVGKIAWLDLTVADAAAALDFYTQVVGWTAEEFPMEYEGGAYFDYGVNDVTGDTAAGICWARGGNATQPPVWMIYVPVGDIEESLRIVAELGGEVLRRQEGEDGAVFFAIVRDPVGAFLGLMPG